MHKVEMLQSARRTVARTFMSTRSTNPVRSASSPIGSCTANKQAIIHQLRPAELVFVVMTNLDQCCWLPEFGIDLHSNTHISQAVARSVFLDLLQAIELTWSTTPTGSAPTRSSLFMKLILGTEYRRIWRSTVMD